MGWPSFPLLLIALSTAGCEFSKSSKQAEAVSAQADPSDAPSAPSAGSTVVCGETDPAAALSIEAAFDQYVKAINGRDWCAAIRAVMSESRPEVAAANFRSLVLLAGMGNPRQGDYKKQLESFSSEVGLDLATKGGALALAPLVLRGESLRKDWPQLAKVLSESPSLRYVQLMRAMEAVDASSLTEFEAKLRSVEQSGSQATGMAQTVDGRSQKITFTQTETGWLVSHQQ